jgi:hypothetical protein
MKMYVGITDNNWFNHLASIKADEVNFWQPAETKYSGQLILMSYSCLSYIVLLTLLLAEAFLFGIPFCQIP